MTLLSEHFSLAEFIRSQTATRHGIANQPNAAQTAALQALCANVLEPVRKHFGQSIRISSGFRSLALNRAIGGSTSSQHSHGEAADFEISGVSNKAVAEFIRDRLAYDQLILEGYDGKDPNSGWIHVSYRVGRTRRMFGTWNRVRGYRWGSL